MVPNQFFRIAEIKYLLFEPKNGALDAFLGKSKMPHTCSTIGDDVTTPTNLKMGPNLFFRIAEIKYLLFEPKNGALDAFLGKSKMPHTCSTIGDDVTHPTTLKMSQKLFFRIAEVKYLLFEPKNSALDAFLRNSEIPPTCSNIV